MIFQKTYVLDWDAQADEKSIVEEMDQTQSTKLQEMLAEWIEKTNVLINLQRITKMGSWRSTTIHGKMIIKWAF